MLSRTNETLNNYIILVYHWWQASRLSHTQWSTVAHFREFHQAHQKKQWHIKDVGRADHNSSHKKQTTRPSHKHLKSERTYKQLQMTVVLSSLSLWKNNSKSDHYHFQLGKGSHLCETNI